MSLGPMKKTWRSVRCDEAAAGSCSSGYPRLFSLRAICLVVVCLISLGGAAVFDVSGVSASLAKRTTETQGTLRPNSETVSYLRARIVMGFAQGPELDYSKFRHTSQKHTSIACTACHERTADNSPTPRFPAHRSCTTCHLAQFVTPVIPMCEICHTDLKGGNPPLKGFPASFNESFNMKFDHAQHLTGAARPQNGCQACHGRPLARGAGLSIPVDLTAHTQCYSCHTPNSKSGAGREIASCGVCHDQKPYTSTTTNARAFRYAFTHAKHGPRERLACVDCHNVTAGLSQSRQVSSPSAAEHFPAARGMTCLTCHNGRRSFGGDLAFKDCRRCHTTATFRMPM